MHYALESSNIICFVIIRNKGGPNYFIDLINIILHLFNDSTSILCAKILQTPTVLLALWTPLSLFLWRIPFHHIHVP